MIRPNKLNSELFDNGTSFVSLGRLSTGMISFLETKVPSLKGNLSPNSDILFWKDRIAHTERHRDDFLSNLEYEQCFEDIPSIIQKPDYISFNKKDNSLSFIKEYSSNISVAIRISSDGKMAYRTMYPLMTASLDNFLRKGTAWRYEI